MAGTFSPPPCLSPRSVDLPTHGEPHSHPRALAPPGPGGEQQTAQGLSGQAPAPGSLSTLDTGAVAKEGTLGTSPSWHRHHLSLHPACPSGASCCEPRFAAGDQSSQWPPGHSLPESQPHRAGLLCPTHTLVPAAVGTGVLIYTHPQQARCMFVDFTHTHLQTQPSRSAPFCSHTGLQPPAPHCPELQLSRHAPRCPPCSPPAFQGRPVRSSDLPEELGFRSRLVPCCLLCLHLPLPCRWHGGGLGATMAPSLTTVGVA